VKQTPSASSQLATAPLARAALVGLLGLLLACRGGGPRARAEGAALRRQTEGLRELLAAAEKGSIFSSDHLAIGIKAELLRDLLQRRLPIETVIGDQLRVRLERAEVSLEGSQSLVTLQGRVSPVHGVDAFADVELLGGLHRLEVDAGSGILTARVELDRIEVQRLAAGMLEDGLVQALNESLRGRGLGALGDVLPRIEIPVHLDQAIEFGGFAEGVVSVRPKRLPVRVSVARVIPVAGRLWILLDVSADGKARSPVAGGGRP
jgi:hypothetical protein